MHSPRQPTTTHVRIPRRYAIDARPSSTGAWIGSQAFRTRGVPAALVTVRRPRIAMAPTSFVEPISASELQCYLLCRASESGPRAVAPPAAREGPHGRRLARGVARAAAGARERRLRGPLRAIVQGGLRRPAAPVPAHAANRAGHGAAARHRPVHHRDRVPDRLEQPGHVRAHVPRRHRREPGRAPRARESRFRTSSSESRPASSAPRTGPTSRSQFRRSDGRTRAV